MIATNVLNLHNTDMVILNFRVSQIHKMSPKYRAVSFIYNFSDKTLYLIFKRKVVMKQAKERRYVFRSGRF